MNYMTVFLVVNVLLLGFFVFEQVKIENSATRYAMQGETGKVAEILSASGRVVVGKAAGVDNISAKNGMVLSSGDRVQTAGKSRADLSFPAGVNATVGPDSLMAIGSGATSWGDEISIENASGSLTMSATGGSDATIRTGATVIRMKSRRVVIFHPENGKRNVGQEYMKWLAKGVLSSSTRFKQITGTTDDIWREAITDHLKKKEAPVFEIAAGSGDNMVSVKKGQVSIQTVGNRITVSEGESISIAPGKMIMASDVTGRQLSSREMRNEAIVPSPPKNSEMEDLDIPLEIQSIEWQ